MPRRLLACMMKYRMGADGAPLGYPATKATRQARRAAHAVLDPLILGKQKRDGCAYSAARTAAYKWLGEKLDRNPLACCIGYLDEATCYRVVEICKNIKSNIIQSIQPKGKPLG
jgi:hypothetical protein